MSMHHASETHGPERLWHLSHPARRLLLLGPPLVLAVFTVLHPQPDVNTQALLDASTWFMAYHVIQLPLLGLVTVSVFLLADELGRASAWPTCLGMGAFLLFFGSYDTLAGMGTALAMRSTSGLPASQQDAVFNIVKDWPGMEMWVFWLSIVGTWGWVLAVGYLAFAARSAGMPRAQWIPLGMAAFFLLGGHPAPFGTLAFGSLFVATLVHERRSGRAQVAAPAPGAVVAGGQEASAPLRRQRWAHGRGADA